MRQNRNKRKYVIIGLCLVVFLMGVGYAAFSTALNINGTAEISSSWDVEITNVETIEQIGDATNKEEPTFTYDTANLRASFIYPGDSIKYRITVSNLGSLNAVIDSAKLELDDQNVLIHEIEGIDAGETLNAGSSKSFTLKITFNEEITSSPNIGNVVASLKLNYLQNGNSTPFSDATSSVSANLTINSLTLTPSETSITAKINTNQPAYKYYFSLDEDVWYESSFDEYTINGLSPNTGYTVYVKAEDSNGEVVKYSENNNVTTTDETNPKVSITIGNSVLDEKDNVNHINYDYYKGLELNVTATDNDQINSIKYCISSSQCTPNTDLTLTDSSASIQMPSANGGQVLYVKATDRVGNYTEVHSEEYKVDGTKPTQTTLSYLSSGDSVTLTVTGGSDTYSGIYKYLYSKDGGTTFVSSDNSNYTFTNLENGSYVFVSKIVDNAGNESEVLTQAVAVRTSSVCGNTITDFGNCIIANESGLFSSSADVTASKAAIQAKGTPSFTVTSPSIVYGQSGRSSSTSTNSLTTYYRVSQNVSFDASTGYYTLQNYTTMDKINDLTTITSSNSYYTCNSANTVSCTTLYEIVGATFDGTIYTLTEYTHSSIISSYDTTTPGTGMYASTDYDGNDTYYFRGAGLANYVHFANKYWRIIRVNGDGTVRMIYDGTNKHNDGESNTDRRVTIRGFNSWWSDNAYVGYMYGTPDSSHNTITEAPYTYNHTGLSATYKYYFGTDYTFNLSTNTFSLAGAKAQYTIAEYKNSHNNEQLYTCFSTDESGTCQRLLKVKSGYSTTAMTVWPIEWSSTDKDYAHSNMTNSAMKDYLENTWYSANLAGYTSKLSGSSVFCNNRQVSTYYNDKYKNNDSSFSGFGWAYAGSSISPTLDCPQTGDRFTVDNSTGNGKQAAPVGLITADEVAMAGGKTGTQNTMYYLYTGHIYWTMSPSQFNGNAWADAVEMHVTESGVLSNAYVYNWYGVRPVINLNPANITFSGSGTYDDPYEVS